MVIQIGDLKQTPQEVEKYLKQEGFTIFYGVEAARSEYLAEVWWAEEESGWKGFLQAAKDAGAKVVIVQASSLEKEDLQPMLLEDEQEETKPTEALKELEKYVGKIGHFSLFWFKDGVKYGFSQATDWWEELSPLMKEYAHLGVGEELVHEIPKEIKRKPSEQLADELVAFIEKEFPEAKMSYSSLPHEAEQLFWESKGLRNTYVDDPQVSIKIHRAEFLARLKLEQETQKREREIVTKLVEECVKWAKENGLKKVTKANVDYFLIEKDQPLSRLSRDAIYNKVNLILVK